MWSPLEREARRSLKRNYTCTTFTSQRPGEPRTCKGRAEEHCSAWGRGSGSRRRERVAELAGAVRLLTHNLCGQRGVNWYSPASHPNLTMTLSSSASHSRYLTRPYPLMCVSSSGGHAQLSCLARLRGRAGGLAPQDQRFVAHAAGASPREEFGRDLMAIDVSQEV